MEAPAQDRPTVLIVDDNLDLLHLLTQGLAKDFTIVTADDGAAGLERYFEVLPDCVVIDVKMPEVDGYQLARTLRGDPASAQTPLVILSAMGQDKDRLGGLLSGVDLYLIKPVLPSELATAIHETLRLTEEERQRRLRALADDDPPAEA